MNNKNKLNAELQSIQVALDELEIEYDKGKIDIGRYLSLKTEYETCKAKLEKELDNLAQDQRVSEDTRDVRHNLEQEPPYFFGRDETLESLVLELLDGNQTIVLRGFGGIGKSTLANKVAYLCMRRHLFEMIVWINVRRYYETQRIDLNTVLDIIVRVYDPDSAITQIGDLHQKVDQVIRLLSQHATLIIFDNFESIIQDKEESAICEFINQLPMMVPGDAGNDINVVRAIITTREISANIDRLRPRIHIVEKLPPRDARKLMKRKFVDNSIPLELKNGEYGELYELTYGNPYLIEFLVGELEHLPFKDIQKGLEPYMPLERSDEVYGYLFYRAWEEILTKIQKHVLMSMTLFIEYAPREAIAAVAGANSTEFTRCIRGLCDMSLLEVKYYNRRDSVAYRIHPLTQEMSEAQIQREPDFAKAAANRFVEYYLQYSNQYYQTKPALIEHEIKNIIAAIRLAKEINEWKLLVEFRDSVNHFMWLAGYWHERIDADESILHACRQINDKLLEARVLVEDLGFTYLRFEALEIAEKYVNEGLEIYKELEDERGIALATRHLGKSMLLKGEYELLERGRNWRYYFQQSSELYSRSLSVREKLAQSDSKEEVALADLRLDFGRLYWLWGRKCERDGRRHDNSELICEAFGLYDKSINASQQGIELFQRHENLRGLSKALGNLGNAIKERGLFYKREKQSRRAISEFDRARDFYEDSLRIAEDISKTDEIAHAKWGLAEIYELYSDAQGGERKNLVLALELARDSNFLYRRMATPADIQVTQTLVERILSKYEAMETMGDDIQ